MAVTPCWYFDKKELRNTPSMLDGIDYETELRYRKDGARFIQDTGTKMDLGYNTMATGVVYFHRFYMFHSFRHFPRYVTASCCLFLAGKVEETPKKCKDIIKAAKGFLTDAKFATFGDDPKEEVMTLERILLQTIKFDLQVEHPYYFLLKYAKCLKGDKQKLQKMVQMAWTFVNDSLCTTLCLQWEPEVIAVALMYLAGKLSKFEVVDWTGRTGKHLRWWDMFIEDVTMDLLEDICHQVLDLYSQPQTNPTPDSPPLPPPPQPQPSSIRSLSLVNDHSRSPIAPMTTGAPIPTVSMVGKTALVKPPELKMSIGNSSNGELPPKMMVIDPTKPPPSLLDPAVGPLPGAPLPPVYAPPPQHMPHHPHHHPHAHSFPPPGFNQPPPNVAPPPASVYPPAFPPPPAYYPPKL
ncbi:Cyclin K [Nesidiocoris tenuis]|uniref:Cyclin K n=1 Tax=Nesidiocoris tenuis TaxID=355587 RepID=A0ABN7AL35_9HEMI|nr:Cyclin K [Nesidiocoris tenuis]